MRLSEENLKIRKTIFDLEKRIDDMHVQIHKYYHGELEILPNWEKLERDFLAFSSRRLFDVELSTHLDRVLFKFQTRKRIWLRWIDEFQHASDQEPDN